MGEVTWIWREATGNLGVAFSEYWRLALDKEAYSNSEWRYCSIMQQARQKRRYIPAVEI